MRVARAAESLRESRSDASVHGEQGPAEIPPALLRVMKSASSRRSPRPPAPDGGAGEPGCGAAHEQPCAGAARTRTLPIAREALTGSTPTSRPTRPRRAALEITP
jgi:hypothetical protein